MKTGPVVTVFIIAMLLMHVCMHMQASIHHPSNAKSFPATVKICDVLQQHEPCGYAMISCRRLVGIAHMPVIQPRAAQQLSGIYSKRTVETVSLNQIELRASMYACGHTAEFDNQGSWQQQLRRS
jgi:hypothetical protein